MVLMNQIILTFLILIFFSIGLAYITWRFIETPFRNKNRFSRNNIYFLYLSTSIFLIIFSFCWKRIFSRPIEKLTFTNGEILIPKTFKGIKTESHDCTKPVPKILSEICFFESSTNNDNIILIGDSHAKVLSEGLIERNNRSFNLYDLSASSCPFFLDLNIYIRGMKSLCDSEYQSERLEFIRNLEGKKIVIIFSRWAMYHYCNGFDNTIGGFEQIPSICPMKKISDNNEERLISLYKSFQTTISKLDKIVDQIVIVKPSHPNGWPVANAAIKFSKNKMIYLI